MKKTLIGTPDEGQERIRRSRLEWIAGVLAQRVSQPALLIRRGTALRRRK